MKRYLLIVFIVFIVGFSLFFVKIRHKGTNSSLNSSVKRTKSAANNTIKNDKQVANVTDAMNNTFVASNTTNNTTVREQVFYIYDYRANAQAMVRHLKDKGIDFPVEIKKISNGFGIYFNYKSTQDKNHKLQSIKNCTGLQIENSG